VESAQIARLSSVYSMLRQRSRGLLILCWSMIPRVSRGLAGIVQFVECLKFHGIRFIAVSQGIDSDDEQTDVVLTVHSLTDSLYVKELAKKTHRGLEGLVLRGLHAGGRTFGFRNVRDSQGVRLAIDESQALILRRIFEMSANGFGIKMIAKILNSEKVPPPRPRSGKRHATWCPTAIYAMLHNELYRGRLIWNRSKFIRRPGTNKRVRRDRPQSEWHTIDRPELAIISEELWDRVHDRFRRLAQAHDGSGTRGLLNRSASTPYLFTGILVCGECGANLVLVTGRGRRKQPKYGCPQHFYRGACSNNLKERRDRLETELLNELQRAVLCPEVVDYAVAEFGRQLQIALADMSTELDQMRKRQEVIKVELRRLTSAVAQSGHSAFLLEAIADREREHREITERLVASGGGSLQEEISDLKRFVTQRLANIQELLYLDIRRAKTELGKHVTHIRMVPEGPEGAKHYVAVGEWNLLGGYPGTGTPGLGRVRLVAGGGFEPPTFGL
jgi:site-specific DNA recombinase